MSFEPIASMAAAPNGSDAVAAATDAVSAPASPPASIVVSKDVTPIMPPGYTQTETVKADGTVTTVITNATGGTVDTIYGTSTIQTPAPEVSVWA
jgi:hypothetical protein